MFLNGKILVCVKLNFYLKLTEFFNFNLKFSATDLKVLLLSFKAILREGASLSFFLRKQMSMGPSDREPSGFRPHDPRVKTPALFVLLLP